MKKSGSPQLADIVWLANLMFLKDFALHFNALNQGLLSKQHPTSQIRLAKPFHPTRENILSQVKKCTIFTKNLLIWWNVIYPETITLRKMSCPRTVV